MDTKVLETQEAKLTVLPGTRHSKFAIPVEYLPSRDYRARYGYSREPIPQLVRWFDSQRESYAFVLSMMRKWDLSSILINLDPAQPRKPAWIGGPICAFDSLALYTMMLIHKPKRYFEIGSGMTTRFARQAVIDGELSTKIISLDPEPRSAVDELCDETVRESLETVDPTVFDKLEPGDIVFLDGSHRAFMNSDVTVFFIDVLPRLKPGVIVHIHDIHLPYDYPQSFSVWYWNEQYMLAVYLMMGMSRIRVLLPTTFICRDKRFSIDLTAFPIVNLGGEKENRSWLGGGSMWFTHS